MRARPHAGGGPRRIPRKIRSQAALRGIRPACGRAVLFQSLPQDLPGLLGDADNLRNNLQAYVRAFSTDVQDIFTRFDFPATIERLHKAGLLYLVTEKFTSLNLHPDALSNYQMGLLFEELLRRFAEMSNETAGEHFTPREVIHLMVELLFTEDDAALARGGIVRTLYDPAAGTGGMLSVAAEHLHSLNPDARLTMFGQELNDESYATCKADMLIRGQDVANIVPGNTLSDDGHRGKHFDYMLSNPPFGVEWKKVEATVREEHEDMGYRGRFGPGLPRISDGSLLFLLHLLSKMRPEKEGGSRIGIVLNGSPLFTGSAGSGESEIRRYVLEQDYVEAIVALPTDMFFNTGIATYVWILTNRKPEEKRGKVQLNRRFRFLAQDAQESGLQAPGTRPGTHQGDFANAGRRGGTGPGGTPRCRGQGAHAGGAVRGHSGTGTRRRGYRESPSRLQDISHDGLRLSHRHRGKAPAAAIPDDSGTSAGIRRKTAGETGREWAWTETGPQRRGPGTGPP
nr:class I SAM-dependent DNA methyltransferase [Acidithiobacillus ferridurans]